MCYNMAEVSIRKDFKNKNCDSVKAGRSTAGAMRLVSSILWLLVLSCGVVAQDKAAKERNPNEWKEFTSAEGKFSVSLPGRPAHQDSSFDTPIGKVKTHALLLDTDMAYYNVSYTDFPSVGPLTPEQNKEMLDQTRDQVVSGDNRLISETEVTIGGTIGRELLVAKKDMILRSRVAYIQGRLYQLILIVQPTVAFRNGKPSSNTADRTDIFERTSARFFDSFKLTQ